MQDLPAPPGRTVVRLELLGDPVVSVDGVEVQAATWHRGRVRTLMALLALRQRFTRSELEWILWPDHDHEAAANNLRVTLCYLRKTYRDCGAGPAPIESDRDCVWLSRGVDWSVDVADFEQACATGTLTDLDAATRLADAVGLYRGELLFGVRVPAVLEIERERLTRLFVDAAVELGALMLERGLTHTATDLANRALRSDPWSERACVLAVRAQIATGDRTSAARCASRCLRCTSELGIPPCRELRELIRGLQS